MVVEIPALFDRQEAAAMRAALEAADWADGRATAGHRAARVKDNQQLPLDAPLARQLGDRIRERLAQTPLFVAATLPRHVLEPRFSRYAGCGAYGNHVDNAIFPTAAGGFLRSDVSCTLFLSEPADYDGGELVIEGQFGTQSAKLPAGHAVVYPASSLHHVAPVTRGVRLVAFLWVQSFVADAQRRRLLFELDGAIQALTADHPEHASIDVLTGTYHNLLRQWSQT